MMCLMDVVQQALLCSTASMKRDSDEARCSVCGDVKHRNEYYIRKSETTQRKSIGDIVQPCRACKLLYEANKRKAKRDAKH